MRQAAFVFNHFDVKRWVIGFREPATTAFDFDHLVSALLPPYMEGGRGGRRVMCGPVRAWIAPLIRNDHQTAPNLYPCAYYCRIQ